MAPKKFEPIVLSKSEKSELDRLLRSGKTEQRLIQRLNIIHMAAAGTNNAEIARELGCSRATVVSWRNRFLESRLAGLADRPRTGRPPAGTD